MKTKVVAPLSPIRIVPMHSPAPVEPLGKKGKGKRTTAKMVYNGGPLLTHAKVFTVFWGQNWKSTQNFIDLQVYINGFFTKILGGSLIDELGEYNVASYKIGHGSLEGTIVITDNAPKNTIDDSGIRLALQQWILTNTVFPQPDANTLYFIYLDSGVTVTLQGSQSCSSFCGYHDSFGGSGGKSNIYYAVMPYPSCNGCEGGLSVQNVLTGTSSHELCEAITDPIPGSGWYDQTRGEIGDVCAWQFKTVDGYNVQLEWSNKSKKCI